MSDKRINYEGDKRTISMEDLEKVLCNRYGWSDYAKQAGCHCWQGGWINIDNILETASEIAY